MNKEQIKQIGEFVLLATDTTRDSLQKAAESKEALARKEQRVAELESENQSLLQQKEDLNKQAEEGANNTAHVSEKDAGKTAEKLIQAGFAYKRDSDKLASDLCQTPAGVNQLLGKLADQELGVGMSTFGEAQKGQTGNKPVKESDRCWQEELGG